MKRAVAIYGFAPQTRDLIDQSTAQEVWALNNFYNYGLPEERVTRTFEMHELWWTWAYAQRDSKPAQMYWEWLRKPHHFTIYMAKVREDFKRDFEAIKQQDFDAMTPGELEMAGMKLKEIEVGFRFFDQTNEATIVRYPLEDIIDATIPIIPGLNYDVHPERGMEPYYISSIDYMSALAVYEQFERIEYYGVELREKTEWAMQKSGATFWAGFARGRGIEVLVPKNSVLIKAPLYGIDGGSQMIPVQVPEELKVKLAMEFDRNRNTHNHQSGRFTELVNLRNELIEKGEGDAAKALADKIKTAQQAADKALVRMYLSEGGMNAMNFLINHENLKLEEFSLNSITRLEEIEEETEPDGAPSNTAPADVS